MAAPWEAELTFEQRMSATAKMHVTIFFRCIWSHQIIGVVDE